MGLPEKKMCLLLSLKHSSEQIRCVITERESQQSGALAEPWNAHLQAGGLRHCHLLLGALGSESVAFVSGVVPFIVEEAGLLAACLGLLGLVLLLVIRTFILDVLGSGVELFGSLETFHASIDVINSVNSGVVALLVSPFLAAMSWGSEQHNVKEFVWAQTLVGTKRRKDREFFDVDWKEVLEAVPHLHVARLAHLTTQRLLDLSQGLAWD